MRNRLPGRRLRKDREHIRLQTALRFFRDAPDFLPIPEENEGWHSLDTVASGDPILTLL